MRDFFIEKKLVIHGLQRMFGEIFYSEEILNEPCKDIYE